MDVDRLRDLYIEQRLSQRRVAEILGVSQVTIRRHLAKQGLKRNKKRNYEETGEKLPIADRIELKPSGLLGVVVRVIEFFRKKKTETEA